MKQLLPFRSYNLHVHKNGYENKKNLFLRGSTEKQAVYAYLAATVYAYKMMRDIKDKTKD